MDTLVKILKISNFSTTLGGMIFFTDETEHRKYFFGGMIDMPASHTAEEVWVAANKMLSRFELETSDVDFWMSDNGSNLVRALKVSLILIS